MSLALVKLLLVSASDDPAFGMARGRGYAVASLKSVQPTAYAFTEAGAGTFLWTIDEVHTLAIPTPVTNGFT